MTEHEHGPVPLKAIHIVLEAADGRLTKLTFTPDGSFDLVSQIGRFAGVPITDRSVERLSDDVVGGPQPQAETQPTQTSEKSPTTVIPGKLQTKPIEGRPDRHGKPTAYARMLGHVDGEEGALLLSTSFHGRTREIALGLHEGAHITAQGYLHRSPDLDRLSTFSVIHLLRYPGKPSKSKDEHNYIYQ